MYEIINWIICVFAIFCILINAVCTFVYLFKSDNGKTACSGEFILISFTGIFGCIMNSIFLEPINMLEKLFLVIVADIFFCTLLFYFSYDLVYRYYMKQVKQDNINKSIKL